MNNIEKLKMHSPNLTDKNIAKIAEIFPNCTTEILDENGKPKIAIDFDLLQQELSGSLVGGGVERYQLNWPGKREALLTANAPIAKTLRPVREESVHFDSAENLFIEGDNLDALKLLQETYLGKVKMIYIDPPYNTGKDFVYADDFAENTEDYLRRSNQKDEDGNRMEVNSESNGRFHSDWLSMMYPRLKLARNLLTDDGVIFISIDDNEQANLKRLCDEVFGEDNFRNLIAVKRGAKSVQAQFENIDKLGIAYEYLIVYSKNTEFKLPHFYFDLEEVKEGTWNNHWRGTDRPSMRYELFGITPETGQWRWSENRSLLAIENYEKMISEIGENPSQGEIDKWYLSQEESIDLLRVSTNGKPEHYIAPTQKKYGHNLWTDLQIGGSSELKKLGMSVFDNPKSLAVLERILKWITNPNSNDIILDFFAGSGTTAHAVMQLNAEDGGNRRFICVQLPEDLDEALKTADANAKKTIQNAIEWLDAHNKPHTIAEITKERIRRAADKICSDFADKLPENWDGGFRVLKTDTSNMADVYYTPEETLKKMQQSQQDWLNQVSDNIKPDRTPEDLLFQVMLDWGVDLALPIEVKQIMGRTVFFVDGNTLIACFDKQAVDNDFITALTQYQPLRVVFRDDSFKDDAAKINTSQIFQQYSESTEVKTI
ncbi:site-specific DNA-methyltransferase [Gallibacterium anatis]|uniref:site-specific DNA-methyltransferase n=1 Tax=Gallibacterium anatis TaxID=750 RepID=UPI00211AF832|nr:site-specific DNA-methyltransferase [Gallibacterium anatis]